MVLLAIASEYLVNKDIYSDFYAKYPPEMLSLTVDKIGSFITQSQYLMKSSCYNFDENVPEILEIASHVNDMFTQVGDVISFLDIFHLFIVEDPAALIQEPFNGKANILSDMWVLLSARYL